MSDVFGGVEILNFGRLMGKFRDRHGRYGKDDQHVSVGYSAPYAVWVHEIRTAYHPVGRAGFLLDVMRETFGDLKRIVTRMTKQGHTLLRARVAAATALLLESRKNCPVDTGFLRDSAFVKVS
jgi:hypothetical protein